MKLNCIVTDDEPIAREIIIEYIKIFPGLALVAECSNAVETFSALNSQKVDILFIDIQMPEINGLELIRSLKRPPMVVFTTAYPDFAVEGFNLDALDYLLKPVSMERFIKAIDKVYARLSVRPPVPSDTKDDRGFLFLKSDSGLVRIDFDTISYIESLENYIKIICGHKTIISLNTMKFMEGVLPAAGFLRIHRSYIINMNKVERVNGLSFHIHDKTLSAGKSYRKKVQEVLNERYLAIPRSQ